MKNLLQVAAAFGILIGPALAEPVIQHFPTDDEKNPLLEKVERKIVKEPTYRAVPKYCLAVFGLNAKTRVWVVVDDDTVYIDLNGNGDLTDRGETFRMPKSDLGRYGPACEIGDIVDAESSLSHAGFSVGVWGADEYRLSVAAGYDRAKVRSLSGFAIVTFAARPVDAPIVHFGGRLSMGYSVATIGDKPAFICAEVGTPGLGKGSCVSYTNDIFFGVGATLRPELELEYAGEKGTVVREKAKFYKDRIERIYMHPVNPGSKGETRKVKMTLSFYDLWAINIGERSFTRPLVTLSKE